MQNGMISFNVRKRNIDRYIEGGAEILLPSGIGTDGGVIAVQEGFYPVLSTETVSMKAEYAAFHGFYHILNKIVSLGGRALTLTVSGIFGPSEEEQTLADWMRELAALCRQHQVGLLQAEMRVSESVASPLLILQMLGETKTFPLQCVPVHPTLNLPARRVGDLIMTGFAGAEGCGLIAADRKVFLCERFCLPFVEGAIAMRQNISAKEAAGVLYDCSPYAVCNVAEGGIFAALWNLTHQTGCGMEVQTRQIPIKQETVEICELMRLNPYQLMTGGSLLAIVPDGTDTVRRLQENGVPAAMIGYATDGNDRILRNEDEVRYLDRPAPDELLKSGIMR